MRRLASILALVAAFAGPLAHAAPPAPGTIRSDSIVEVDAPASGTNRLDQLTVTGMSSYSTEAFVKSLGKYFALVPYTGSPPDGTTLINATDGRQWQVVTGGGGGGSGITQLTGDGTAGPGSGSQAFTLAASGVTAATYGSATAVMVCAIDAKGRATSCSSTTISVPSTAISDSTTLGRQLLTAGSVAAAQGFLSLTPGTNVQGFSANLSAFAGLSLVADRLPYANGTGTLALTTYTSLARTWDAFTTSAQQTAALNTFTSSLAGLAPSSGGGTTNYLRADGNWAAPSTAPSGAAGGSLSGTYPNPGLSSTGISATTYGDASHVAVCTWTLEGRSTGCVNTSIAIAAGAVSGLATVATSGSATDLTTGTLAAARIAANSLPISKLATGTAGNLLTWDASGQPAAVATGTTGQALLSNGPGAAPTFQTLTGGGNALTTNPLSQFAATTSSQFFGVISDESGSGLVIGGTNPTFASYNLHTAIAAPSSPSAGFGSCYIDSTSLNWVCKTSGGVLNHGTQTSSASTNQFVTGVNDAGALQYAQPSFTNLSGSATCGQLPALTGVVTSSAGSCATSFASTTGTGANVLASSPSLTTPTLGVASATSINKVTVTAPATGSTLTIDDGFTLHVSANATISGTNTGDQSPGTGTGALVGANSPTLVTPALGVATATSVNKVAFTAPATSATVTIANGTTLTTTANASVSGTNTGDQTITLTGPVTGSGTGSFATSLTANGVVNVALAQMGAGTIKGNNTGSTANAADLTATQVTAMLNLFGTSLQGLTPASGGGTTNFLRADGTWAAPTGGGTVTSVTASSPLASSGGATPNITVTSSTGSGAIVEATSPTITTPTLAGATLSADLAAGNNDLNDVQTVTYDAVFDNGNKTGASPALLTWNAGANQKLTLTGNITGTSTWTLPPKTQYLALDVCQNGTGGFTMAWPAVTWDGGVAPTLLSAANACTRVSLRYDGTTVTGTSGVLYAKTASLGTAAFANGTTLLRVSALTSGTSLTKASGVTMAVAYIYAGGGGGGGCATASSAACAAGGGAAGGRAVWVTSTMPASAWTYAIGAAGTAGTTSGTTGGAGGSSTLSNGTTTVTANGGPGGTTAAPSASAFVRLGGAPPSISTNGTVNGSGDRGDWGGCIASSAGCHSGAGASSDFGAGGNALNAAGAGNAGVGPGAGGSGAISTSTSFAGGVGTAGLIILYEYE